VDGVSLDNLEEVRPEEGSNHRPKSSDTSAKGPSKPFKSTIIGSSRIDQGSRTVRPELLTSSIRFSPTGREWAAATTQGLEIFGLDDTMAFLPTDLDVTVTPQAIDLALSQNEYGLAINMALQLNEREYIKKSLDMVPSDSINLVVKSVNQAMIQPVMKVISEEIVSLS